MKQDQELFPVICCPDKTPRCAGGLDENESSGDTVDLARLTTGQINTPAGPVPRISARIDRRDQTGSFKARLGLGRMNYRISPDLYAVGDPDENSPVLVSANYKLSFDILRRELVRLNAWLLVIDTNGINVWCAAGKGTFCTAEVVRRIAATRLREIVAHRTVILPQLAAPGVAAHEVRRQSGFKVIYGPVRAADIPAFLDAGNEATPAMRATRFGLRDRLVLTPVELTALWKPVLGLILMLFLLNLSAGLLGRASLTLTSLPGRTLTDIFPFIIAILIGTVLVPALLPYIPGRALAWKGWLLGTLWTAAYLVLINPGEGWLKPAALLLFLPAIAAFLSMNFTGSTTYTSLSGVVKEMGVALPLIIVSASLGAVAYLAAFFL